MTARATDDGASALPIVRMLGQETLPPPEEIERVVRVLLKHFPELDPRRAPNIANGLIWARDSAAIYFVDGEVDRRAFAEIASLASRMLQAVESMTPGGRFALDFRLLALWDASGPFGGRPEPGVQEAADAVVGALQEVREVAHEADLASRDEGKSHWRNIAVIDEARAMWARVRGEEAPQSGRSGDAEPRFQRFVGDLFFALGIGHVKAASQLNAYGRWVRGL